MVGVDGIDPVVEEAVEDASVLRIPAEAVHPEAVKQRGEAARPLAVVQVDRIDSNEGDVAARVAIRFAEIRESLGLCRTILLQLPPGPIRTELPAPVPAGIGIGLVEGWRGPVFVALETDAAGAIRRCHPHDPSWHNWPVLEHAVIGNIVPDFPLINKSFNLSYSGVDL